MDRAAAESELVAQGWSLETFEVWLRAHGYCEYCGKDLQRDPDDYFFGYNIDHIVPASLGGSNHPDNRALACRACNLIKRNRDFRDGEANLPRDAIISRARKHIAAERERNRSRLEKARILMTNCGLARLNER